MLSSSSVQEAHDLAVVAHVAAMRGRAAFLHFFEGFRTSHALHKIAALQHSQLIALWPFAEMERWRCETALSPEHPRTRNPGIDRDIHWQLTESKNGAFGRLPDVRMGEEETVRCLKTGCLVRIEARSCKISDARLRQVVESTMDALAALTGRHYKPFVYMGAPDADRVIIAMGRFGS